jgi:hypothetical protein
MKHVYAGASEINTRPTKEWEKHITQLIGRKILVLRDVEDHIRDKDGKVLLYRTDDHVEQAVDSSFWGTIVAVGSACRIFSVDNVGDKVKGPDWGEGVHALGDGYYIFNEKVIGERHNDLHPYVITREASTHEEPRGQ